MDGYGGQILRVDLTKEKIVKQPIPREWITKYIGGEGINDKILWDHFLQVDPMIDPISSDNILIGGIGPLGCLGTGLGSKMKWTFKSPVYNMFGDTVCGGFFQTQMKFAGYDHIAIIGKAKKPVYIWIDNDNVEIRDAKDMWGKTTWETDDMVKKEVGDDEIQTITCGPAGENLVRFANILNSRNRAAGRTGGGCVMGSKNLKAIAARGTKDIKVHDPKKFLEMVMEIDEKMKKTIWYDAFPRYGSTLVSNFYDGVGCNAGRNWQRVTATPYVAEAVNHDKFTRELKIRDIACSAGCVSACSNWWYIKGDESPSAPKYAGEMGDKPEYVVIASSGIMCDIPDMPACCHYQNMINKYGVDCCEMGSVTSFLMELWQRGIINEKDVKEWGAEGIRYEWGNVEALEFNIESVALQKNKLGKMLSGGVYQLALQIEKEKKVPVLKYANYGKGHATFVEDARATPLWAVLFATSSRGTDHLKGLTAFDKGRRTDLSTQVFGQPDAGDTQSPVLKGKAAAWSENYDTAINCLGPCNFVPAFYLFGSVWPNDMARFLAYATGIEMSGDELLAVGERVQNLEHGFNKRLGFTRKDDTCCERWMKEPCPEGPGKGMKMEDWLDQCLDEYYEFRGWDKKTAYPTRERLEKLGVSDVADVLEKEGKLAGAHGGKHQAKGS